MFGFEVKGGFLNLGNYFRGQTDENDVTSPARQPSSLSVPAGALHIDAKSSKNRSGETATLLKHHGNNIILEYS